MGKSKGFYCPKVLTAKQKCSRVQKEVTMMEHKIGVLLSFLMFLSFLVHATLSTPELTPLLLMLMSTMLQMKYVLLIQKLLTLILRLLI